MADLEVFYEDQHLIVLSKPPGLLSQGGVSGEPNLVDLLRVRFGRHYVGLIHRLDRNTSGLMVVAKRTKAADRLSEQLRDGTLVRKYTAILWGDFSDSAPRKLAHWLLKNEKTNEVRVVPPRTPGSKEAILYLQPLRSFPHPRAGDLVTLAEFTLETGRGHQIRAQCNAIGHPIIGDQKYGAARSLTLFPRPALHSCYLSFSHPMSKQIMTYEQRYSVDMIQFFSTDLE